MIIWRLNGTFLRLSRCLFNNKNNRTCQEHPVVMPGLFHEASQNHHLFWTCSQSIQNPAWVTSLTFFLPYQIHTSVKKRKISPLSYLHFFSNPVYYFYINKIMECLTLGISLLCMCLKNRHYTNSKCPWQGVQFKCCYNYCQKRYYFSLPSFSLHKIYSFY